MLFLCAVGLMSKSFAQLQMHMLLTVILKMTLLQQPAQKYIVEQTSPISQRSSFSRVCMYQIEHKNGAES